MSMLFKRIKDWATSITAFRTGDVIPVDGPSGTAKMSKDDLLRLTAENALDSINLLSDTATEADLVEGNYLAIDGSAGPKKLPGNLVATKTETLTPSFSGEFYGNNTLTPTNVASYFTTYHFENGKKYTIKLRTNEEAYSISCYNTYQQGTIYGGYDTIEEAIRNVGGTFLIEYTCAHDGYLYVNSKSLTTTQIEIFVYAEDAQVASEVLPRLISDVDKLKENNIVPDFYGLYHGNNEPDNPGVDLAFYWSHFQITSGNTYTISIETNESVPSISTYIFPTYGSTLNAVPITPTIHDLDGNYALEFTAGVSGVFGFNCRASRLTNIKIKLFGSVKRLVNEVCENNEDRINANLPNLDYTDKAKAANNDIGEKFIGIKAIEDKDVYCVAVGDSIMAYLNISDTAGDIASCQPTTERKCNAFFFEKATGFGIPNYRRFDYGKASLVGDYDDRWSDDSSAFFIESGTFKTEYIGAALRTAFPSLDRPGYTTHIDSGTFPYPFNYSEVNNNPQQFIPKRFSNDAEASVSFTIPSGWTKFDFVFDVHEYGDNLTVSVDRGNGVVTVNSKPNDWSNATEANGYTFSSALSDYTQAGGGNDANGIVNMRLHFRILNKTTDTTITITKTSDTSKYLIYWGACYWGDSYLNYAMHFINAAIGGTTLTADYDLRDSLVRFYHPTCVLLEVCLNSLNKNSYYDVETELRNKLPQWTTYLTGLGLTAKDIAIWVPHISKYALTNFPKVAKAAYLCAERTALKQECCYIGSVAKFCDNTRKTYGKGMNEIQWQDELGSDGTHLKLPGYELTNAMWENC